MAKKGDFLDPTQQHTLTEQECELVAFFRALSKTKRDAVMKTLFTILLESKKKKSGT